MAKHDYRIDEKKVARFIAEGRGQGSGKTYKPWLTIQDVPSEGRTHRPFGWKTERVHHLLSDIEYRTYLLLNWSPEVTDIREQFPLDRKKTVAIATEMAVNHPRQPGCTEPMVMTTDFLVVAQKGKTRQLTACSVKPAKDLDDPRVVEKLEIERRYWNAESVDFIISTETTLPMAAVQNLDWFYSAWDLSDINEPHEGYHEDFAMRFLRSLPAAEDPRSLAQYCADLDQRLDADPGTALLVCRHLLAHRRLTVDLHQPKLWKLPISQFLPGEENHSSAGATGNSFLGASKRVAAGGAR